MNLYVNLERKSIFIPMEMPYQPKKSIFLCVNSHSHSIPLPQVVMSEIYEKPYLDGQKCFPMEKFGSNIILHIDKLVNKLFLYRDFKTFPLFKLHLNVILIPTI